MKKLHLVSNAHLDPAWLWRWNEGLAEAISTFRVAADFCEEYDGYIFNHNEALLYEWVEEHEPALFARIQKLCTLHLTFMLRIKKRTLRAGRSAILAHAHRAHRIKAHAEQRADIHIAQLAIAIGMRMDAADHAQAAFTAA